MTAYYTVGCDICEHPIKRGDLVSEDHWHHEDVNVCRENIRADERAKAHVHNTGTSSPDACCECCYDVHSLERDHLAARRRVKELLDERKHLRAQVKALRHEDECDVSRGRERPETGMAECNCLRADVLALLGGESE